MASCLMDNDQSLDNFVGEKDGKAISRPKLVPVGNGNLNHPDDTIIDSRAGGTGYGYDDEGYLDKMASYIPRGDRQRCRQMAKDAEDNPESPALMQADWGFLPHRTDYPPGSPTQENIPTGYKQRDEVEFPFEPRRSNRNRAGSWKVREAGSWNEILRRAAPTSSRRRKRKCSTKGRHQQRDRQNGCVSYDGDAAPRVTGVKNKFLDSEGDIVFPSLEELCDMTVEDHDELCYAFQACS